MKRYERISPFFLISVSFLRQIDQPLVNDRGDGEVIDEPFVNYQERMTRAMKELTRSAQDMVSTT